MAEPTSTGRNLILNRIRAALTHPAPPPCEPNSAPLFAPTGDLVETFRAQCAANLVDCAVTRNSAETSAALANALASIPDGEVFVQDAPALRQLVGENPRLRWSTDGPAAESAQATITLCESLIASTGSIFVSSSTGGRTGSIVAPCHIVFATVTQLQPDLQSAFAALAASDAPRRNSFLCLVTGSSRTADIEKILVLGAHGPKRVVVVLQVEE